MPINYTSFSFDFYPGESNSYISSSSGSILDDISYVQGNLELSGYSAWLIYATNRVSILFLYR